MSIHNSEQNKAGLTRFLQSGNNEEIIKKIRSLSTFHEVKIALQEAVRRSQNERSLPILVLDHHQYSRKNMEVLTVWRADTLEDVISVSYSWDSEEFSFKWTP